MKKLFSIQLPQDVRDLLDTLVSEIQTLKTQLEEVKQLMAISEADFTLLQNKVSEIELNLSTLTQTVESLQTGTGTNITALLEADTALATDIQTLQNAEVVINTTIGTLQEADTVINTALQSVLNRLTTIEAKHLTMASRDLTLGITQVTDNLVLPVTDEYESTITWVSSDELLLSSAGIVTRPSFTEGNKPVTLTATIVYGEQTVTKDFVLEVVALPMSDQEMVDEDATFLTIDYFDGDIMTGGIQVSTSQIMPLIADTHGSTIEWASNDPLHFDIDGTVVRPAFGETDATVLLTATLTKGLATATANFTVIVLAETEKPI